MRTAFIINDCENESLLRFTETKLFFDADNKGINFVDDCLVIQENEIPKTAEDFSIILTVGDFLTTTFRKEHQKTRSILDTRTIKEDIIRYSKDTQINFDKRISYKPGSKELYIVENMLKTCLRARELIYLENTELENIRQVPNDHFFGLASGWKSMMFACANEFKSVTVFDVNERQLQFAKQLHELSELPDNIDPIPNSYGKFAPSINIRKNWKKWHNMDVNFCKIDLFEIPKFPINSFVWISNVFNYESNIFKHGWKTCKDSYKSLLSINEDSIIKTT